jgi:alpha-1,6-mannosyltransferase
MKPDMTPGEGTAVLATGQPAGAAVGTPDATVSLSRLAPWSARVSLPRPSVAVTRIAGLVALAAVVAGTAAIVLAASSGASVLVPRSWISFPGWLAGPLHGLLAPIGGRNTTIDGELSAVILAMTVAYLVAIGAARALGTRTIVACVVAVHVLLLMAPPFQLNDLWNYLGYARLGGLHGLNPYTHVLAQASHDPVYEFTTWANLPSPYGPLFTTLSYPLAWVSLPVAYWSVKVATVLASLGLLAIVYRAAHRLGRDPRVVLAFVALNPVYVIYAVGGFHNDFFMLLPAIGAVAVLVGPGQAASPRRQLAAGALLMVAVAVKFTAVLLLPFLLLAVPSLRGRARLVAGTVATAIPLVGISVAMFGLTLPNLSDQSTLLTQLSIPNLVGDVLGFGGGAPWLLHLADAGVVVTVAWLIVRRRDWLVGAGWATLALIASLAWLMPWYVVWLLPLAAFGTSLRLRAAAVALTAYLVITFIPSTGIFLQDHGINPLGGAAGMASQTRQRALEF